MTEDESKSGSEHSETQETAVAIGLHAEDAPDHFEPQIGFGREYTGTNYTRDGWLPERVIRTLDAHPIHPFVAGFFLASVMVLCGAVLLKLL
jgi:hypothetical protein